MAYKKQPSKSSQLARAQLLSYPQLFVFALIFATIGGLTVWTGFAAPHNGGGGGKPPKGGNGTLSIAMVSDQNSDGLPNWGDVIRFNVTTTATTEPHVNVTCSQNGAVVYGAATGYYASYPWPWTQNMTLSSASWTSGAADCTAILQAYSGTNVSTLGSLSFHVNP